MSTALHLSVEEYDRMVLRGAFDPKAGQYTDHVVIHRGQTISPLACPGAVLKLDVLFASQLH
jgi:hypothetical protein